MGQIGPLPLYRYSLTITLGFGITINFALI